MSTKDDRNVSDLHKSSYQSMYSLLVHYTVYSSRNTIKGYAQIARLYQVRISRPDPTQAHETITETKTLDG